LQKLRRLRGV